MLRNLRIQSNLLQLRILRSTSNFRVKPVDILLVAVLFFLIVFTYYSVFLSSNDASSVGKESDTDDVTNADMLLGNRPVEKQEEPVKALAELLEAQNKRKTLYIPRILHHYFSNASGIPLRFVSLLHSWSNHHTNFSIYYWNSRYVEEKILSLPQYRLYQNFYFNKTETQYERDLINRLILLYHFGGISVELHMQSLGDVSEYLKNTKCVFATDRTEKAILMYSLDSLPSMAFLASVPKHFFIKFFLDKIVKVELRTGASVLNVNAVQFLNHVVNAAYSYFDDRCATKICEYEDRMTQAEPSVFLPLMEEHLYENFLGKCQDKKLLTWLQREACYNLEVNKNSLKSDSLAYPFYINPWEPNKDKPLVPLHRIPLSPAGQPAVKNFLFPPVATAKLRRHKKSK